MDVVILNRSKYCKLNGIKLRLKIEKACVFDGRLKRNDMDARAMQVEIALKSLPTIHTVKNVVFDLHSTSFA